MDTRISYGDVRTRRLSTTAWVIVSYYDACGAVGYGIGEDFAWMNEACGERAYSNGPLGNQTISTIKGQADKMFLFFIADVR